MIREISLPAVPTHARLLSYLPTSSVPTSEPSQQHRLLSPPRHILGFHFRALTTAPTDVPTSPHPLSLPLFPPQSPHCCPYLAISFVPFQSPHYSTDCCPYLATSSVPTSEPSLQHRLLSLPHHILCSYIRALTTAPTDIPTSPHPLFPLFFHHFSDMSATLLVKL